MQSYSEFVKSEQIQVDEDFKDLIAASTRTAAKMKERAEKAVAGLGYERRETVKMIKTFLLALKDRLSKTDDVVTDADVVAAIMQLRQVGKLAMIAPLFLMPGGGTTTAVLYVLGKKWFGVSILPKGLESVFESVRYQRINQENIVNE